jgi:hypothetical protein
VESVCREILSRLGIPEPGSKQLPKYLVELQRKTNLEKLIGTVKNGERLLKALSSLAENSYQVAHEAGDRHAHGDGRQQPPEFIADMLVASSCALTIVLVGALSRNELKAKG